MGVLRSCYFAPARAYYGGPEVVIRWYFTEEGAPLYREGHVWEPIRYRKDRQVTDDSIGELPRRRQPYYNGANTGVRLEPEPCGTGADYRGEGTVPKLPDGRIDFARWCDCAYRPCIGWEVVTHPRRQFIADLVAEGLWTEYATEAPRWIGDIAAEGDWHEQPQTGGWYFSVRGGATYTNPTADHVCFHAADSLNCGGTVAGRQHGHARKHYEFTEPTTLHFDLTARVERENEGYDGLVIKVDGVVQYARGGTEEGLGCSMTEFSDTLDVDVSAGTHQIDLYFDTVDGLYHVGCFWCVELTFTEGSTGGIAVEGIFTEYDSRDLHFIGELVMEGEGTDGDQPDGSFAGELAMEGPSIEGDEPEGSFSGDLAQEGEFNEL